VSELLSRERALALVLERARPLEAEDVPIADAGGRVTAEAVRAAVDLPPFRSSAMDGFAVRAADTPGTLAIVDRVAAGRPATRALAAGEAMGIATGGVVPDGADAVVPVELVVEQDNTVDVPTPVAEQDNIRPVGGDVHRGDAVVDAGTRLGPSQVGAVAAAGVGAVRCTRRPRAVVLPTGTELRAPGEELAPGEIYESNGLILAAQLHDAGADVERLPTVADDEDETRAALARALEADVVVTSGGVSVGPHDLVRRLLTELGAEEVFWRVAVKPGKPVAFATLGATLVFGLPGNPVSALVGFELFVRPAVRALQGADPGPHYHRTRLARPVRRDPARDALLRARLDGDVASPLSGQESHMIVRAAAANALVLVPRGEGEIAEGESVSYLAL
jgi:molybdopterin molybdotransferase